MSVITIVEASEHHWVTVVFADGEKISSHFFRNMSESNAYKKSRDWVDKNWKGYAYSVHKVN